MPLGNSITAYRVEDPQGRSRALEVLHEVYRGEKAWTSDPGSLFPASDLDRDQISWFVAERRGQPASGAGYTSRKAQNPSDVGAGGRYEIVAGSDADNDLFICDSGEACGAWLTLDQPIRLTPDADRSDLDFPVEYQVFLPELSATLSSGSGPGRSQGYPLSRHRCAPQRGVDPCD